MPTSSTSSTSSRTSKKLLHPGERKTKRRRLNCPQAYKLCHTCNYTMPHDKKNFPDPQSRVCAYCLAQADCDSKQESSSIHDLKQKHELRLCRECNMLLPLVQNFEVNSTNRQGRRFWKWKCKVCRRKSNRQLAIIKRNIDMARYDGKPCPICERLMTLSGAMRATPDHCHKKGTLRGVICNDCNTAIGKLGDDVQVLKRAIRHLEGGSLPTLLQSDT